MLARFHRSVVSPRDRYFKIRNILNLLFILLVILTITLYFVYPIPDGLYVFFSCCLIAIMIKAVEVYFRMLGNKSNKQ